MDCERCRRIRAMLDRGVADVARQLVGCPAAAALPPGRVGPYAVERILGEGGMGIVYLGRRDGSAALSAIKVLCDAGLSPARRRRFAREERILARMDHPSIARLHGAGVLADGTPWLAMEYVDGVRLTEHCRRRASSLAERLRLFVAACEAVQHAHQRGVVHCDVKPSNVLVKRDGRVKLVDFGAATEVAPAGEVAQADAELLLMTPRYAAPEQLRGERVGVQTDVYALGVVLRDLVACRVPLDPALEALCRAATHEDPRRRYGSVAPLVREVELLLARAAARPAGAAPRGAGPRGQPWSVSRRRVGCARGSCFA